MATCRQCKHYTLTDLGDGMSGEYCEVPLPEWIDAFQIDSTNSSEFVSAWADMEDSEFGPVSDFCDAFEDREI